MRRKTRVFLVVLILINSMKVYASDTGSADTGLDVGCMPEDAQGGRPETELSTEVESGREPDQDKEVFYQISLPADSKAYLDPGNLSGRGQIFSDSYKVENYGNTDIAVKIKNIDIYCQSSENIYEFSRDEIAESCPSVKKLQIEIIWKNESEDVETILNVCEDSPDEYVLFLKAANYDDNGEFISLAEGGIGSFCFTGTVNSNPDLIWEDGEITVSFNYEIVNMEKGLENTDLGHQEGHKKTSDDAAVSENYIDTNAEGSIEQQEEPIDDTKDMDGLETEDITGGTVSPDDTDHLEDIKREDEAEAENSEIMNNGDVTDSEEKEKSEETAATSGESVEEEMYKETADDEKNTENSDAE